MNQLYFGDSLQVLREHLAPDASETMQALHRFVGENDMMAYLTMMANRLLELRRVKKGEPLNA